MIINQKTLDETWGMYVNYINNVSDFDKDKYIQHIRILKDKLQKQIDEKGYADTDDHELTEWWLKINEGSEREDDPPIGGTVKDYTYFPEKNKKGVEKNMNEKAIMLLKGSVSKILRETESIENLIVKSNDSKISKIVDLGKLKSELDKYCDKVLGYIDSIKHIIQDYFE